MEQTIGAGYDKTLITLSGGALGLTITFIKNIVPPSSSVCMNLAVSAWGAWSFSLAALLIALYFGTYAYRYAIKKLDAGELNSDNPGGPYAITTNIFNVLGGVSFLVGVVLFIIFTYMNYGG